MTEGANGLAGFGLCEAQRLMHGIQGSKQSRDLEEDKGQRDGEERTPRAHVDSFSKDQSRLTVIHNQSRHLKLRSRFV